MVNYYFSKTWAGLDDGTVVNVIGGGTATIGTDAFADSYYALMQGADDYGQETYGDEWVIKTCDVYVDKAYAGMSAGDPIDLTVVNPDDTSETYDIPGVLTYGTDAMGSDATSTATECKAILNAAKSKVSDNGVGAIVVTDINGDSTYAFGNMTSTGGFFADGKMLVIDGVDFTGGSTGSPISGGGANATINNGSLVTNVVVNDGYVWRLWAGGVNGTIAETNVTLNGGSVKTIGGGYSGTILTANYYIYGGDFESLLATNGATVNNANILVDTNGGTITGYISVTGNATAQAVRLTNDFNLVVRDTTMTQGTTGNRGGTISCNAINMTFINSSVGGTIGIAPNYGGIQSAAVVNSFVITVDGSTINKVDAGSITVNNDGKRTLRATGSNSTISDVTGIHAFVIDADTCLAVTTLSGTVSKAASITVDATGYVLSGDTKVVFVGNTALTGDYTVLENGTTSSRFSLDSTGGTIYLKKKPAIFSVSWTGLEDGTPVAIKGGTATIGTDAFATYAEAAASGLEPFAGDIYCSSDFVADAQGNVTIDGYVTPLNGTDAFDTIAGARNAFVNRLAVDGAIRVIGGSYTDASGTGTSQTQFFNGCKTTLENVYATTMIAGKHNSVVASTDMTVTGSTITSLLSGGNRANYVVTDTIKLDVTDSNVKQIQMTGAGLGTSAAPGTAEITITGSSVGTINAGQNTWGDVVLTVNGGTVKYLGGAGAGDANISHGNMTFNLNAVTISKMYSNRGINESGGGKQSYVEGDVVLNVYGGTTTIGGDGQIGYSGSSSTTINLKADSLLKFTNANMTLTDDVAITINVDGYSGMGSKLVLDGKNVSSNTITITGEDASKYNYYVDGTKLYLNRAPDAYFSIGWSDLAEGDVVSVSGGTAVIGTNAFSTYDAAVAAVGDLVSSTDVYFNYDWVGTTAAGDVVDVTTPGGTFSAVIGDGAYNTLSSALNNVSSDGYVHVVGGSTTITSRVGLLQKDVWFTNTTIVGSGAQGDLCGVYGNATDVTDGRANVVIGEGSYVTRYYVSRGNFSGDAVVTVRDGGYAGTLFGSPTSAALTGGSTTINVLNGGSVGAIYAVSGGTNTCAAYINIVDSNTGNVLGSATATASRRIGDLFVNISGSTIGNFQSNSTGTTDITGGTLSFTMADSVANSVSFNNGTIVNNGTVLVNISNSSMIQYIGPTGGGDDMTINFSGSTVAQSLTTISGGTYGALTGSVTDSTICRYYNAVNGTVTSANITVSGGRFGIDSTDGGINGVTSSTTLVNGDANFTLGGGVLSRYFYAVASNATVGGDVTVALTGGSIGELRIVSSGTVSGSQTVDFASGTTTIGAMKTVYTNGADATISAGATLVLNETDTFAFKSLTLDGELALSASRYTTALAADGFAYITGNASGTGTVTVDGYVTGSLVNSDNNLYAYLLEQPVIYVNSDWADEVANHEVFTYDSKSLLGGVSAFTSADDAKAFAGTDTEIVLVGFTAGTTYYGDGSKLDIQGGSYKALVAGERIEAAATITTDTEITFESGTASFIFGGTYIAAGGDATISGDSTATISGGEFDKFVCGGNVVATGGSVTLSGDSTLNISGGVFSGVVAGGSDSQGGKITTTSDYTSNLNITGGTFNRIFGGNVASKLAYASFSGVQETLIDINGSTNVSIDSSANNIVINGDIVAGSYGVGQITGDTSITFKGLGDNLDFSGKISGDSQNAGTYDKCVSGTRSLVFDNFSGSFSGNIRGIDSVSFSNGSAVVFDDSVKQFYLKYASEWNFGAGTSLTWTNGINDFGGDTMNLTFNDLDSEWTVFTGSASTLANFDDMSVKFNGGASLSYDEGISGYSDGSYALTIDSDNSIVKLAKLA